ncbi:MAG: hypothetical protein KC416_15375, partial [Myxococcales bacterium]|nr:hypothetical protein [Myxococcales bacterium]
MKTFLLALLLATAATACEGTDDPTPFTPDGGGDSGAVGPGVDSGTMPPNDDDAGVVQPPPVSVPEVYVETDRHSPITPYVANIIRG